MLALSQMMLDYLQNKSKHNRRATEFFTNSDDHQNIENKIVVVTGANSGIGKETALECARRGATVIMACRCKTRAEEAKIDITKQVPSAILEIIELDLGDLASVRKCAAEIKYKFPRVDILINNAGILETRKRATTKHGFEASMGVNHLGPFLLTLLLLDHLKKAEKARIISVSSLLLSVAHLNMDDLMMESQSMGFLNYTPYANSKLANALFIKELARRLSEGKVDGISCYALCPGFVSTNFMRNEPLYKSATSKIFFRVAGFNASRGCQTVLYCALSKSAEKDSGRMYRFLGQWDEVYEKFDDELAAQLWTKSEELVGFKGP